MGTKPKTREFFDSDFIENQLQTFPEEAQKINDKLDELSHFFHWTPAILHVCIELQECLHLLEEIKKQHQSSVEMPGILLQLLQEIKKIKGLDLDNDLLLNNSKLDAVDKINISIFRLKQCVNALAKEAEKKEKQEES